VKHFTRSSNNFCFKLMLMRSDFRKTTNCETDPNQIERRCPIYDASHLHAHEHDRHLLTSGPNQGKPKARKMTPMPERCLESSSNKQNNVFHRKNISKTMLREQTILSHHGTTCLLNFRHKAIMILAIVSYS
jgi:hypothetical protein